MLRLRHPILTVVVALGFAGAPLVADAASVTPSLTLTNAAAADQDDLCIWLHPTNTSLSTFIVSDKSAGKLFVYDLSGTKLQQLNLSGMPGNIDIRYAFSLDGELVDLVVHNDRDDDLLVAHAVDRTTRMLTRVDFGNLLTGPNYGMTLYRSPTTKICYAFTTSQDGTVRQFRLEDASGLLSATQVRSWSFGGITEGCVGDDETGQVYFAEENVGIWKVGGEPEDPTGGTLIAQVGDASGLTADVEGLTLYYASGNGGYLLASSQGSSSFKVYGRAAPHPFVTSFDVSGVSRTDGIDVINLDLGPSFPFGLFACHDDSASPKPVVVCAYEDLGLATDTAYWDPRTAGSTARRPRGWGSVKSWHRRGTVRETNERGSTGSTGR